MFGFAGAGSQAESGGLLLLAHHGVVLLFLQMHA
jgi:hypothetical protein